jgi:uncharacterized protein (TIGR03790 family)
MMVKTVLVAGILAICSVCSAALDETNVLVLYNTASPEGQQIAEYYAQVHPGVHLLGIDGVTTDEVINAEDYLDVLRPQVTGFLATTPDIDCIVTTKGLPARIHNTSSSAGYFFWKPYSSLESELTRIDTVDTLGEMGDQNILFPVDMHAVNPYYKTGGEFDRASYEGIRLTSRLDGYTVADVTGAIDRAQQAVLAPAGQDGLIVIDDDPNAAATVSDRMGYLATELDTFAQPYVLDNTDAAVLAAAGPVIGYVSHGVNDGAGGLASGYIDGQLDFDLAAGAVFQSYESFNAYSFTEGGNRLGQELLADWLAAGGTAGVGHVEEPTTGGQNIANEDVFWQMLLEGYTWAEAAWSSIYQLSYVNTVVGDPLMTFSYAVAGDLNGDGVVDAADIDFLAGHLGDPAYDLNGDGNSDSDDITYLVTDILGTALGDYNLDGFVDAGDLATFRTGFGSFGGWSDGDANGDGLVNGTDLAIFRSNYGFVADGAGVPEPATLGLMSFGALSLIVRRRRK